MWRKTAERPLLRCSFCNKHQDDVMRLIAGPRGLFICDECVQVCNDMTANVARFQETDEKKDRKPITDDPLPWPKTINCSLCGTAISTTVAVVIP